MKFCNLCGASVTLRIPAEDSRPRHVCTQCDTIHYENPKLVVGAIPVWEDRVLLCRRAIEPRHGLWTLPGGFMENGESTGQAAIRETLEEAHARVELDELYSMYSLPYINQVHLFFRARLLDLDFAPGIESLEVRLFGEADIPWQELAFRPVRFSLEHFFNERKQGKFSLHVDELAPPPAI
ncbi:MAG: NUDIX hydrolase [Gallionella sp.]|nr:NUDIX hydrolase [Gallionella sp.]